MPPPKQRIPPIISRAEPPQPPPRVDYKAIRISVPLLPPPNLRGNSAQSKRLWAYREDYRTWALFWQAGVREWLRKRGWPVGASIDPAEALVLFVVPDRRRRDIDNYIRAMKPAWDVLVALGLLKGDSSAHLVRITGEMLVDKAEAPLTIIELRRVGGAQLQNTPSRRPTNERATP